MKAKTKFLQDRHGNNSMSRLITLIVTISAIFYTGVVIYFGRETIVQAAAAAVSVFGGMTSGAYIYMFKQKQNENVQPPPDKV